MRNRVIFEDFQYISPQVSFDKFRGKKVLITGATGMLASYIIEILLFFNDTLANFSDKIQIYSLARDAKKIRDRYGDIKRNDMTFIIHDMAKPFEHEARFDFIIHAASNANPALFKIDPVGTILVNVLGMISLLKIALRDKVESFLFFSSGEIYGNTTNINKEEIGEEDFGYLNPVDPRSCYAESKRIGEALAVAWYNQFSVPVKIVRPFHVYGPGMRLNDGRVFSDFVYDVVNKRNITVKSDGRTRRSFCYIADATIAFLKVLLSGQNAFPYNVGNPSETLSVLDLAKLLVRLFPDLSLSVVFGEPKPSYMPSKTEMIKPNIDRITMLGWKPQITTSEGFNKTVRSFK